MTNESDVYFRFYGKVVAYARSHLQNVADAEDVAQEVFFKVHKNLSAFDPKKASLSTWIYAITRNEVIDFCRKRKINTPLDEAIGDIEKYCQSVNDQTLDELASALETLPQNQRDAVILYYRYGYSHKEIAAIMNLTYDNARKICSLAISSLRKKLKN